MNKSKKRFYLFCFDFKIQKLPNSKQTCSSCPHFSFSTLFNANGSCFTSGNRRTKRYLGLNLFILSHLKSFKDRCLSIETYLWSDFSQTHFWFIRFSFLKSNKQISYLVLKFKSFTIFGVDIIMRWFSTLHPIYEVLTWKIIGYVKFKLIIQMTMRYSFGISQLRKFPVIMASLPSCRSNMSSGPHPHPSQVISWNYLIQNFYQLEYRKYLASHVEKMWKSLKNSKRIVFFLENQK